MQGCRTSASPYPSRFLFASKPEAIGPVLAIVHRVIAGWFDRRAVTAATRQADQAGVERVNAQCLAVTLIQRFGSALNLNIHSHMLWLDGVYEDITEQSQQPPRKPRLHRTHAPTSAQLTQLAGKIAHRVCRHLTRKGWLEGEDESAFLSDCAAGEDGMDALRMSSITYRIATGKHAGRKVVTEADAARRRRFVGRRCRQGRRLLAARGRGPRSTRKPQAGKAVPVHHAPGDQREVAVDLAAMQGVLGAQDPVAQSHRACRMGCGGLHRQAGGAGPATPRAQLTPSGRGKRPATDAAPVDVSANDEPRSPEEKRRSMTWAQRLTRVFGIDGNTCIHCGGAVRIVASIEERKAIRAILGHFEKHGALEHAHYRPPARVPPAAAACARRPQSLS